MPRHVTPVARVGAAPPCCGWRCRPPSAADPLIPLGVFLNGAVLGVLYALVAFGVILVHKASRILNFASAALGAVPESSPCCSSTAGCPTCVGLAVALAGAVVIGILVESGLLRPFRHQARLVVTVATIGVAQLLVLVEAFLPRWVVGQSIAPTAFPTPFAGRSVEVGGVVLTGDYLAIVVLGGALMVGLAAFFRVTDTGIAVRAAAENADRAALLGIPVARLGTTVWVLAAVCSALAVFLRGPVVGVSIGTNLSPVLLLYGLAAAVLARMSSLPVALLAGMGIGILEQGSFFSTSKPDLSVALILPVLLAGLLRQRRSQSRADDTGVSSFRALAGVPAGAARAPRTAVRTCRPHRVAGPGRRAGPWRALPGGVQPHGVRAP